MPVECAAERRDAVRAAASDLRSVAAVEYCDVHDPDMGDKRDWTLRVCVTVGSEGSIPPEVLKPIVAEGLHTEFHPPRGTHRYLLCSA